MANNQLVEGHHSKPDKMASGNLPMIGLSLMDDILMNPPPFIRLTNGDPLTWAYDPSQVTMCVSSFMKRYFPGSFGRVMKFDTEEEFEMIAQGLTAKPLFLHVDLKYETKYRKIRANFFVTVNTAHPVIKSQLLKSLNEARTQIKEGRRVALEIDFNPILDDWFRDLIQKPNLCGIPSLLARHAKIVITNSSEFFQPFRCGQAFLIYSVLCLPLCLVTYPAYRLYRKIRMSDTVADIQGEVKHLTWSNGIPKASTNRRLNWHRRTTFMGIPIN